MTRYLVAGLWLAFFFVNPILAQQSPIWQAADDIRTSLFEAQRILLTADDPAEAVAAVETATTHYTESIQPLLSDANAAAAISEALTEAQQAAQAGDGLALAAARGQVWTGLLWAGYVKETDAVAAGDIEAANQWLRLREYREATRVTVIDSAATQALTDLQAGRIDAAEAQRIISADLRDAYFFRLREALNELEAAADKNYAIRGAEWAGQAQGYFAILRADFAARQSESAAAEVAGQLDVLVQSAVADEWATMPHDIAAVQAALSGYSPVTLDATEVQERGQLLYLFTELVYIEYRDGVKQGQIVIPIEYQEAITFRTQAEAVFEELRPVIAANDAQAAERLASLLAELETIIADLGPGEQVEAMVNEALGLIETNLAVAPSFNDTASAVVVINTLLDEVVLAAEDGRYTDAEFTRLEAYAMFENGMEQRLANRAPLMTRELEGLFWEGTGGQAGLATRIRAEAPAADIAADVAQLKIKLDEAQVFLAAGVTPAIAILNSFAIILREGLEAVLIIGAILGYMRAINAPRRHIAWVAAGVGAAIALSLLTWWAATSLIAITFAGRELIEGITSLIAVAVLFYVTNWLFHKIYVVDWLTYVKTQVGEAISNGSAFALAALGFTVVYREGFETVLFYQALLFDADGSSVAIGFIIGLVIILVIAYAILRLSKRLPLKPFFTVTGILLMTLAFSFTGAGIRALQEAGYVSTTLLPWMPESLILMEAFGLYPTVETTLAQAAFLVLIVATFALSVWQGQSPAANPAPSN